MAQKSKRFQPGAVLHESIIGAFRASGSSFNDWCHENRITPSVARNATFGQSRGPAGRALLDRIIDAAGEDFVAQAYARRIAEHAKDIVDGAA